MKRYTKLLCSLLLAAASTTLLQAQNTVQSVRQVTDAVELTNAVDFTITSTTPFATTGSVDLQNADAVVIFESVRPATVKSSYLRYITINGAAAKNGTNCWVEIYKNGTIIYPHTELTFKPFTGYSEANFQGTEWNNFVPYTKYISGDWVNNIRSFKLKRGYMVTLGTNSNGQGWSKVFIAQDADLEIDLKRVTYGKYIAGKAGFIRVFPWRNVTKKGTGGSPENRHQELNTTWMYGWNGDGWHDDYVEHIPQHHHEGWPSWSGINGLNTCNTVLGNNEPDNQGDDREEYIPVDDIESRLFGPSGSWQNQAYTGGLRVGSPAMSGDARGGWLSKFMELAAKYNCRIDFIADHCYWHDPGSSFNWQMNETFNKYKRPIWITEFNYGANWTAWERDDRSASDANQTTELNAISDIVTALENNVHVERYAFYNWVEDCRALFYRHTVAGQTRTDLTKAGVWYANLKSNSAYTPTSEYTMGWTYSAPTDLKATLIQSTNKASLVWTHMNGKQTDSVHIERKLKGESNWTTVATLSVPASQLMSYQDNVQGILGLITYRVRNFDSDNQQRVTGEASVSVAGTQGSSILQYGTMSIADISKTVTVPINYPIDGDPAVFMGLMTYNNANVVTTPFMKITDITSEQFNYIGLPWSKQSNSKSTYSKSEDLPYMVIPQGNYNFGNIQVEVGTVRLKDTVDVVFNEPFPEGVTPVVIATVNGATNEKLPIMHKVWNVTETGFRCNVMYEDGETKSNGNHTVPTNNQTLAYIAVTPGDACVDPDAGIYLAAGIGGELVSGNTASDEYFEVIATDNQGEEVRDTLRLIEPVIFCEPQTKNLPTPQVLRTRGRLSEAGVDENGNDVTYVTGFKVRRIVDESVTSGINTKNGPTADQVGWLAIHTNPVTPVTGIGQIVESTYTGNELNVDVVNRIVYVREYPEFELFTSGGVRAAHNATQAPGVYIVRAGGKTAKIIVK